MKVLSKAIITEWLIKTTNYWYYLVLKVEISLVKCLDKLLRFKILNSTSAVYNSLNLIELTAKGSNIVWKMTRNVRTVLTT